MRGRRTAWMILAFSITLIVFAGCASCCWNIEPVDYAPLPGGDWEVSTPEAEGLDPAWVEAFYCAAARLRSIYGLLIVKNGNLVAEAYFNEGGIDEQNLMMSVSKSYIAALVGIAAEQGYLTLDQRLVEFYPEYEEMVTDPRKNQITVQHLLQMRSGLPWEESSSDMWSTFVDDTLNKRELWLHFPLTAAPGTEFNYSNLTSYLLGDIVQRATGMDLRTFAEENLFGPTDTELGEFWQHELGYYHVLVHVTARDAARFGQLYQDGGRYGGVQVIPEGFLTETFTSYSSDVTAYYTGPNVNKVGYGYQWWLIQSGNQVYWNALGHGGQTIALLDEHDMVIVAIADPHFLEHGGGAPWRDEKAMRNLVCDAIAELEGGDR